MSKKRDISNLEDIKLLVDSFYSRVRSDELIGPIFERKIEDRWPEHLDKMYRFWQTILLKEHTYSGAPFRPHAQLPVKKEHFVRWVSIFKENLHEKFEGEVADEAMWRAEKMAEMFNYKIDYFRQQGVKPIF